jgi:hypothetical protein
MCGVSRSDLRNIAHVARLADQSVAGAPRGVRPGRPSSVFCAGESTATSQLLVAPGGTDEVELTERDAEATMRSSAVSFDRASSVVYGRLADLLWCVYWLNGYL